MTKTANISKENEIAFIALSNPPMNALSQGVRAGLKKAIEDALNDSAIKAISFSFDIFAVFVIITPLRYCTPIE